MFGTQAPEIAEKNKMLEVSGSILHLDENIRM